MIYPSNILPTKCGKMIKIDSIEIMGFVREDEDAVIDILQADWVFSIRSKTGVDYEVSALGVKEWIKNTEISVDDLVQSIFNKWAQL